NAPQVAIIAPGTGNHRNSSTGPTPDCSPPSPDTALKNIVKVIRPQAKQRTSIVSAFEFNRLNQSHHYFEINSSVRNASFNSSSPVSPANCSTVSVEDSIEENNIPVYIKIHMQGSNVMEDQDLLEIGILNSGHRQRILQAIQLLPKMKQTGSDGYNPTSVAEWLDSLELGDYIKPFLINGYTSMDLVKKIWDIELINIFPQEK
ncbi:hypothetical protein E2320_003935, partial [Naja naja]